MTVTMTIENSVLTARTEGRVDSATAPELEKQVSAKLADAKELIMDFSQLEYISSAGLRVLLVFQKRMNKQGKMKIVGANAGIKQVFRVTGFDQILTVE